VRAGIVHIPAAAVFAETARFDSPQAPQRRAAREGGRRIRGGGAAAHYLRRTTLAEEEEERRRPRNRGPVRTAPAATRRQAAFVYSSPAGSGTDGSLRDLAYRIRSVCTTPRPSTQQRRNGRIPPRPLRVSNPKSELPKVPRATPFFPPFLRDIIEILRIRKYGNRRRRRRVSTRSTTRIPFFVRRRSTVEGTHGTVTRSIRRRLASLQV